MYRIPKKQYTDFVDSERHHDIESSFHNESDVSMNFERESILYRFKKMLKREIEGKLKEQDFVNENNNDRIKISEITFNYENTDIINMMIQRGNALDVDKTEKARKIENKIKEKLKSDWDIIKVPREAYITFKTEESYLRAIKLDSTVIWWTELPKEEWRGHPLVLEQIQEPSNIYWENRHINRFVKIAKQFIVVLVLLIILFAFIGILFYIQKLASKVFNSQF